MQQQRPLPAEPALLDADANAADDNTKKRRRRRVGRGARRGNSLLALLDALVGKRLLFELRDDAVVSGRLAEVDDRGAFVVVEDAAWRPPPCRLGGGGGGGQQQAAAPPTRLPSVHIRGRALRFVHLPGSLDPAAVIEAHVSWWWRLGCCFFFFEGGWGGRWLVRRRRSTPPAFALAPLSLSPPNALPPCPEQQKTHNYTKTHSEKRSWRSAWPPRASCSRAGTGAWPRATAGRCLRATAAAATAMRMRMSMRRRQRRRRGDAAAVEEEEEDDDDGDGVLVLV